MLKYFILLKLSIMDITTEKEWRNYYQKGFKFDIKNYHKKVLELIPKSGRILELGVGDGTFLHSLQNKGYKCLGVDLILENIKNAEEKGLKIVKHDLNKKLPFEKETFDILIALEVLEHINNYQLLIKEIYRILKNRGVAFISVPNCTYWKYQLAVLKTQKMPPEYTGDEGHVIHKSLNQWKEIISKYFEVTSYATEDFVKKTPLPHNLFCRYAFFKCVKLEDQLTTFA